MGFGMLRAFADTRLPKSALPSVSWTYDRIFDVPSPDLTNSYSRGVEDMKKTEPSGLCRSEAFQAASHDVKALEAPDPKTSPEALAIRTAERDVLRGLREPHFRPHSTCRLQRRMPPGPENRAQLFRGGRDDMGCGHVMACRLGG